MTHRKHDIMTHVTVRKTLRTVAQCLVNFEGNTESHTYLTALREELDALIKKDISSPLWAQATQALEGPEAYALQRIGFLPEFKAASDG